MVHVPTPKHPTAGFQAWSAIASSPLGAALILAAVFGLYTSFRYHFAAWGLDPDSLQAGYLWQGVREYGWRFLQTSSFSPDNWIFSLVLPSIPLFDLTGPEPAVILSLGWISFVGTALMAGIMAGILSRPVVAIGVTAFVLLSRFETLGPAGFMSHPASHDLSLSWGLLVVLLLHRWQRRGGLMALVVGLVILCGDDLSDPWALIGVAIPCLAGSLVGLAASATRFYSSISVAGIAVTMAVSMTKAFGILDFLPTSTTSFGDWQTINSNFIWLCQSLGLMFDPIPGGTPGVGLPPPIDVTLACLGLVLSIVWGAVTLARLSVTCGSNLWLFTTLTMSAILPCLAFVLSDLPANIMVGRFAASLVVLTPVIALSALGHPEGRKSFLPKYGIPAFFLLIAATSVFDGVPLWATSWKGIKSDGVVDLTRFLLAHGLTYGYGEYWGTNANSVSLVSHSKVIMRPVEFDPRTGEISRRGGASLWYGPEAIPKTTKHFFVAFKDDGENCRVLSVCENGVQRQFGTAEAKFNYNGLVILAWNKPIVIPATWGTPAGSVTLPAAHPAKP